MIAILIGAAILMNVENQDHNVLTTKWGEKLNRSNVLAEYPRPQLVRKEWMNLNGEWNYLISENPRASLAIPEGKILVPFCVESALSGVKKQLKTGQYLIYERNVKLDKSWAGKHVVMHFEAVDYDCEVLVNGSSVGTHRGGYDSFSFDITKNLKRGPDQTIKVVVRDDTLGFQCGGKQVQKASGIWYTPTSGIWQTVWLESVPRESVTELLMKPNAAKGELTIFARCASMKDTVVHLTPTDGKKKLATVEVAPNTWTTIKVANPKLWSPSSPFLYGLDVDLKRKDKVLDHVESYFAFRDIEVSPDAKGIPRIKLNGEEIFMTGLLDQGYWPDGILTAPTDDALKWDIEQQKEMGFNTIRKHVKVEPERWYYWCDKLGMMVIQDMPSPNVIDTQPEGEALQKMHTQYKAELQQLVKGHINVPSIVMWVVFNEGWGQHNTPSYVSYVKSLDSSRLINNASGWTDTSTGDLMDIHNYPDAAMPKIEKRRAAFLGEFGGLGLFVQDHNFSKTNWGYQTFQTKKDLTDRFVEVWTNAWQMKTAGLCGAIYTQLTDVEIETNGMWTYDRKVFKLDKARAKEAILGKAKIVPPTFIVPAANTEPQTWEYSFDEQTGTEWTKKLGGWKSGKSGFGAAGTPGSFVNTVWKSNDIYIRREVELKALEIKNLNLWIHHDEGVEVYVNGALLLQRKGFLERYGRFALNDEQRKLFKPGKNLIAAHCHQTQGGQYLDFGFVK